MKTIIEFFDPPIIRLCLLIALGMGWMAGCNLVPWSSMSVADWAAWIGAIGTVGTLIWTVWLATAADRRRVREENARAVVATSALNLRMTFALELVRGLIRELESENVQGYQYGIMAESIDNAQLWTDEEVLPLMILPRNVTAELVAARDALRHCSERLRSHNPQRLLSPARSATLERNTARDLRQTEASLDVAATECHRFFNLTAHFEY